MPKKRFTDEQIAFALRQAAAGTTIGEICRSWSVKRSIQRIDRSENGIAEATFYR